MKKHYFAIAVAITAISLSSCGSQKDTNEVGVRVASEEETDNGQIESSENEMTQPSEVNNPEEESTQEETSLEGYGKAMVMDNGSVSLKMESNILSTDEEKADTTTYIVTLPDISGYRADETEEWADDTDDDEWLETMVKAYMSNGVIPKEMPLQGGDRVLIRITSVGGSEEYAEMEGTEQYIWLSSNTSIDEAEEMMKGAHVGDTLSIPITGSDSEEDVAFEIEIESATGSRTMDDLCMEWIEANYPEYDSIDAFLEKVKSGRRKSGTELSEEGEFSLFLNYLTENSTIDGLEENEDHARTMLVEAAYLASHGVPINEEAFENYREENPDVEDSDEARTEFVRSAFVAAMYEDISG